jgi:hypothetical protein
MQQRDQEVVHVVLDVMMDRLDELVDDADKFVRRMINEVSDNVNRQLSARKESIAATLPDGSTRHT